MNIKKQHVITMVAAVLCHIADSTSDRHHVLLHRAGTLRTTSPARAITAVIQLQTCHCDGRMSCCSSVLCFAVVNGARRQPAEALRAALATACRLHHTVLFAEEHVSARRHGLVEHWSTTAAHADAEVARAYSAVAAPDSTAQQLLRLSQAQHSASDGHGETSRQYPHTQRRTHHHVGTVLQVVTKCRHSAAQPSSSTLASMSRLTATIVRKRPYNDFSYKHQCRARLQRLLTSSHSTSTTWERTL
eukprot:14132-Heterococcus_DN1.PRE.9